MLNKFKYNKYDKLLYIIIFFILVIYVGLSFNDSLWGDEAYTMLMLKNDFVNITLATASDVHPPLYYYITKLFTIIFGYSVTVVKIASIVPIILSCVFIVLKSKKLFSDNSRMISLVFILLIGFSPIAYSMNIELRMYSWAMFFVTCSGVQAYQLYIDILNNKKSRWSLVLFILSSLAAAYTHYYAALSECFIYLFLIISLLRINVHNWKICFNFCFLTIIGYLPWIPIFYKQFTVAKNGWWLDSFPASKILDFIKYLFESEFLQLFLFLIALILLSFFLYAYKSKKTEDWFAIFAILSFALTVLFGFTISKLIRPLFLERYMYPSSGLFFLAIGIALSKIEYKTLLQKCLISLIVLNAPFSFNDAYILEYKNGTEEFKNFAIDNIKSDDVIYTNFIHLSWTILPYYLPNNQIVYSEDFNGNMNIIFTTWDLDEIKQKLPTKNIIYLFSGNIDNVYNFNIYRVE